MTTLVSFLKESPNSHLVWLFYVRVYAVYMKLQISCAENCISIR